MLRKKLDATVLMPTKIYIFFLVHFIIQEDFQAKMRTSDTIIEKRSFKCDICDHIWYRKYDYENHLKTKKHEKIKQKIENFRQNIKNKTKENILIVKQEKKQKQHNKPYN